MSLLTDEQQEFVAKQMDEILLHCGDQLKITVILRDPGNAGTIISSDELVDILTSLQKGVVTPEAPAGGSRAE